MLKFSHFQYLVLLTATFVFSLASFAQTSSTPTPTPLPTDDDEIIKVDSRLIIVPVSVTDASGQAVSGLKMSDFKLTEESRPQAIENVGTADTVPLEIALLFDVSGTTNPTFTFQQEAAAKFLREVLKPADRATIYTIGTLPILLSPSNGVEASVAAVRSIVPTKGSTAFFDTVDLAAGYLKKNAPAGTRRVVVVISDGEDTNSARMAKAMRDRDKNVGEQINTIDSKTMNKLTVAYRDAASTEERSRVSKSLQNADTVFYAINPAGSSYQLNKISLYGQANMQKFADETGGTAFLPKFQPIDTKDGYKNSSNATKNTETLAAIFRQLANELRSQYLIQYYSDAEFPVGRFVKLNVDLQNQAGRRIRARQGYYVTN